MLQYLLNILQVANFVNRIINPIPVKCEVGIILTPDSCFPFLCDRYRVNNTKIFFENEILKNLCWTCKMSINKSSVCRTAHPPLKGGTTEFIAKTIKIIQMN